MILRGASFLLVWLLTSPSVYASQVLDLGKMQVQGKARSPELRLVDPDKLSSSAADKIIQLQIEKLEQDLLAPEPAPPEKVSNERMK